MSIRITFKSADFEALRAHVLRGRIEEAAVCLGGWITSENLTAILVQEVHPVPPEALVTQSGAFVEIDTVWLAALIKRARTERLSVIVVHSHPFSHAAIFSSTDTDGQAALLPRLQARVPGVPHAEIVFGRSSADALLWRPGEDDPRSVNLFRVIGSNLRDLATSRTSPTGDAPTAAEYARQVLFLGDEGQRRLAGLRVGVVGEGGNGSPVTVGLIHLGVGTIVTVDHDLVEAPNRNRIIDSCPEDDDTTSKVQVVYRYAERTRPTTKIIPVKAKVEDAWESLKDCDLVFGCTDDFSSRYVLNRLAVQYYIPLIDTAMEIEVHEGALRTIAGRVNVIRAGQPCLESLGFTNKEMARTERGIRRRPGYVDEDPAAAAMPANLLVAGVAGIEFLKFVHGLLGGSRVDRYWAYSARSGELRGCGVSGDVCQTCQEFGGLGDAGAPPVLDDDDTQRTS